MTHHHSACCGPQLPRRIFLGGMAAGGLLASGRAGARTFRHRYANAPRLIVLNAIGGLDGLGTVIPYGDPNLAGLRSGLVPKTILKVDPFYALHPSLPGFNAMFTAGQALAVHAVGPTLATRSHFEAQDCLQSGTGALLNSGWLNRALALSGLPNSGMSALAETPLLMRGPTPVGGFSADPYLQFPPALLPALTGVMAGDPDLFGAMSTAFTDRAQYNGILGSATNVATGDFTTLASTIGALMANDDGPRIVGMEFGSFDTHADQVEILALLLTQLDSALVALKTSLGSAWDSTVVMTMTEFGRTAYQNGTQGTDHGTGFAVLLAGGAVQGGRVVADWPGLDSSELFQQRDLMPTVDFRSVAMGVLMQHLGLPASTQQTIFPGSIGIAPMTGLVA